MRIKTTLTLVSCAAALFLAGCGGGNGDAEQAATDFPETSAPAEAELGEVSKEVVITANDQMKFNIETFSVKPGETVRILLKNVGTMPKFSMGHNVVVLDQSVDPVAFVSEGAQYAAADYIPPSQKDKVIAATELLGGGEEDAVVFKAPTETGDYPFVCSFPGHLQVGMGGTMQVQ